MPRTAAEVDSQRPLTSLPSRLLMPHRTQRWLQLWLPVVLHGQQLKPRSIDSLISEMVIITVH